MMTDRQNNRTNDTAKERYNNRQTDHPDPHKIRQDTILFDYKS